LGRHLVEDGAEVTVSDVSDMAVQKILAEYPSVETVTTSDDLVRADLDVFAPCAMGDAIDDDNVHLVKARVICGAANNQLAHAGLGSVLESRGILYAPDFCVNSGGLIQVADELDGFSFTRAKARAERIYDTTLSVFARAESERITTEQAANQMAEERMRDGGRSRSIWLPEGGAGQR